MKRIATPLLLVLAGALALSPAIASAQAVPPTAAPAVGATANSQPVQQTQVSPLVQSAATGTSVNTQINNTNLGMNSYGVGVQCASPQLSVNTYTQGVNQGAGANANSNGVNIGFVTPLGVRSQRACQALADEILHQRQLDTQLTMIAKCGEFQKAGYVLSPVVFPELAKVCAGVTVAVVPTPTPAPVVMVPEATPPPKAIAPPIRHMSDFTPRKVASPRKIASACRPIAAARKAALIRRLKRDAHRRITPAQADLDADMMRELRAACVPDRVTFMGLDG